MSDRIIYVLCYDDITEQKAHVEFDKFPWARVYRIPENIQNHLFEGVMYQSELMKVYDEWKDKKYVGTVAYCFFDKVKLIVSLNGGDVLGYNNYITNLIENTNSYDFIGFFPMICYKWPHPFSYKIMKYTLKNTGLLPRSIYNIFSPLNTVDSFYYFNYWMATPQKMLEYINFFNKKWLPTLESHPYVWQNAEYEGKLTREQLLKLTSGKCDYYPLHPFINERLPNFYFKMTGCKI